MGPAPAAGGVERFWADLIRALSRLDAERQHAGAGIQNHQGADLSGLANWLQGSTNCARPGTDPVSMACGTGTQLKAFKGLQEGACQLSW
jgi:hypothetical protein